MLRRYMMFIAVAVAVTAGAAAPASAISDQQQLVERARLTILSFLDDPNYPQLRINIENAAAVVIVPALVKGGFIFGGEGGKGVLLARNADGSWSDPSFVVFAGGSFGLQFGGAVNEVVLSIMTEKGLNAILDNEGRIGADFTVAMFAVGTGAEAHTGFGKQADMYAFSRGKGLFLGGALEGGVITEMTTWNHAYYSPEAGSRDILAGRYSNPQSVPLSAALP